MLAVRDLTLSFGGLVAVNQVSLDIKAGRISGLIGPNGAGKTTFFNLIGGVYKPDSGSIVFDGRRIDGWRGFQINRAGIARTYQVINLFRQMTVVENVLVGMHSRLEAGYFASMFMTARQRREEREALDKAYSLLEFVNLQDRARDSAGSLPYGEQRLLEIVRGLASDPRLILLDEPAAGMNSKENRDLDLLLKKILDRGVSILMIEHDMKLVMGVCDYIYVLNYGRKLAEGAPSEVQANPEVITAYLGDDG